MSKSIILVLVSGLVMFACSASPSSEQVEQVGEKSSALEGQSVGSCAASGACSTPGNAYSITINGTDQTDCTGGCATKTGDVVCVTSCSGTGGQENVIKGAGGCCASLTVGVANCYTVVAGDTDIYVGGGDPSTTNGCGTAPACTVVKPIQAVVGGFIE